MQASGNIVVIDDTSLPNQYFGNIYLGSESWRTTVYYDTLADWNVISNEFDIQISDSFEKLTNENGDEINKTVIMANG